METNYRNETTFSLSNGYLGTRGTLEEGYDFTVDKGLEGNFINGFYESEPIRYGEWNYGFPTESQSLLNLPDLKTIRLFLDGEELDIRKGEVSGWRRTLHMDQGTVTRSFDWTSPAGRTVHVETVRLVSFGVKNLMAMSYEVTPVNFDGEITFLSVLDANVENHTRKTNPLVDYGTFGRCLLTDRITADESMIIGRRGFPSRSTGRQPIIWALKDTAAILSGRIPVFSSSSLVDAQTAFHQSSGSCSTNPGCG